MNFSGTQALSTTSGGTANVLFGANVNNGLNNFTSGLPDTGTLTINAGVLVHGHSGYVGGSTYPVINNGTIAADVSGGTINLSSSPFTNNGVLTASNGGTLNALST